MPEVLFTVEQVSLLMGEVWPMREAERGGEAKGPGTVMFKNLLAINTDFISHPLSPRKGLSYWT